MPKRNTQRVDLQKLFRWKRELPIIDENGDEVDRVWQRVVSDKEREEARLNALRTSRDTRLALRDEGSLEFAALAENIETVDRERLVGVILTNEFSKMYDSAAKEISLQMPKHPGPEATLEQLEIYENEVDEYNDKRSEQVMEVVDRKANSRKEKLGELEEEEFLELARRSFENQICSNVVNEQLLHYSTYLGTYKDEKCNNRYFKSYSEFEDLSSEIKQQLTRGYSTIRVGQEELKN
jgi:hypothetical protein